MAVFLGQGGTPEVVHVLVHWESDDEPSESLVFSHF